ncbi:hypothetical protein ACROYT_G003654 [Oculina patagonica]
MKVICFFLLLTALMLDAAPGREYQRGEPCPPETETDDPQGRCCVFPFVYEGESYDSCIGNNHNMPWCSLDAVYDGNWANCGDFKKKPCEDDYGGYCSPPDEPCMFIGYQDLPDCPAGYSCCGF